MKAEIITVGTELLMGSVIDTNSPYLAQSLESIGIGTYYKQTIGDNKQRIKESLAVAIKRADIVILAGGIGPTRDDITKEAVAEALNLDLIIDQNHLSEIEVYFKHRGRTMTHLDQKQAQVFVGSTILPNDNGLALGCVMPINHQPNQQFIIILPGPPHELEWMVRYHLLPYLNRHIGQHPVIQSKFIDIKPIGEAYLAEKLDALIQNQTNPTMAIYAKEGQLQLRLTASASTDEESEQLLQELSRKIEAVLGKNQIIDSATSLEASIIHKLTQDNQTLSLAESLTGGLVSASLTSVPGAGEVLVGGFVTYQTSSKFKYLDIDLEFINRYSVVSAEVAKAMAWRCQQKSQSDYGLSLTGVAGPDSLDGHPVGQVFIGLATIGQQVYVKELNLGKQSRAKIRQTAKDEALKLLKQHLK